MARSKEVKGPDNKESVIALPTGKAWVARVKQIFPWYSPEGLVPNHYSFEGGLQAEDPIVRELNEEGVREIARDLDLWKNLVDGDTNLPMRGDVEGFLSPIVEYILKRKLRPKRSESKDGLLWIISAADIDNRGMTHEVAPTLLSLGFEQRATLEPTHQGGFHGYVFGRLN